MVVPSVIRQGGGIVTLLLRKKEGAVPSCHGDKVRAFPRYRRKYLRQLFSSLLLWQSRGTVLVAPHLPPRLLRQGVGRGCPSIAAQLPWRRRVPWPRPARTDSGGRIAPAQCSLPPQSLCVEAGDRGGLC